MKPITNYLKDKQKYLDPKLFIRLLETYFNCYIYIFSQNSDNPLGILSAPYFLKEYLMHKQNPALPIVLIYEHFGNAADNAKYPQCELIQFVDSEYVLDDKLPSIYINSTFKYQDLLIKHLKECFHELYQSPFTPVKNPAIPFTTEITGQGLDYYGKTRFFTIFSSHFKKE